MHDHYSVQQFRLGVFVHPFIKVGLGNSVDTDGVGQVHGAESHF